MTPRTTSPDSVLQELVAQRNREIEARHARRAEQLRASEESGQRRLKAAMDSLGQSNTALIQKLDEPHAAQAKEARAYIADLKAKLAEAPASIEAPLRELRPAFAPSGVTTLNPYYLTLYNSSGGVIWHGSNPGRATLWDECWGSGSGIFGTGV